MGYALFVKQQILNDDFMWTTTIQQVQCEASFAIAAIRG